jgi:hypothetical protein
MINKIIGIIGLVLLASCTTVSPTDMMFIASNKMRATTLKYTKEAEQCMFWFYPVGDFTISGIAHRNNIDEVIDVVHSKRWLGQQECLVVRGN